MANEVSEMLLKDPSSGRRGPHGKEAENPLGIFLQERLNTKGITKSRLAVLLEVSRTTVDRILYGNPSAMHSVLQEQLCKVLGLNDAERSELQRLINEGRSPSSVSRKARSGSTRVLPGERNIHQEDATSEKGRFASTKANGESANSDQRGRGRSAKPPKTDLGKFLQERLNATKIKRSELARQLNVPASTVTRIMNGAIADFRSELKERLCFVLALNENERNEFYRLAPGRMLVMGASLLKYMRINLDKFNCHVAELQGYFDKGNAEYVLREAANDYNELRDAKFPARDIEAALIQWKLGMLLATARDASAQGWSERIVPTLRIYNMIEKDVLLKLPIRKFPTQHARVLASRAPLYREMGNLKKSMDQFTTALDEYVHEPEDERLLIELYYSRAHLYAVQGDEHRWRLDIDQARKHALKADPARREELLALVIYTEGEGYKRLAFNNNFSMDRREWYAAQGVECFRQAHMELSSWVGHAILNKVAQAQSLALIEPDEAIRQANELLSQVQRLYPAITQKIHDTINYAQRRLQQKR